MQSKQGSNPADPLIKYLLERIQNHSSDSELEELLAVTSGLMESKKKVCAYCKWYGHNTWDCPVDAKITFLCKRDPPADLIRSEITLKLRVAYHKSLRSVLGKRKAPDFR